jgi:hypothetical protein
MFISTLVLTACESSSPCGPGQRHAVNDRDGAKIQYCVRKDDGRAQGLYTCELHGNRGSVIGTFDANFKHGEWQYLIGGKKIRIEQWHNDVLKQVKVLGDAGKEELECDGHVIAPHPEDPNKPAPPEPAPNEAAEPSTD